jgi:hypothetical protein
MKNVITRNNVCEAFVTNIGCLKVMYEINDENKLLIIILFHRLEQHQPIANLSPKGQL